MIMPRTKSLPGTTRLLTLAALLLASLGALVAFGASPAVATAQETSDTATYPMLINVEQCDTQEICDAGDGELLGDITVQVTSEDGSIDYGTCVTSIDGKPSGCTVNVEPETTVAVTVEAASIPDGYAQLDYPIYYDVPAEVTQVGDVWVYLLPQQDTVPDDADTDEEGAGSTSGAEEIDAVADATAEAEASTAALPSTGTGADGGAGDANAALLLTGALATISVIAAAALVISRRGGNELL